MNPIISLFLNLALLVGVPALIVWAVTRKERP